MILKGREAEELVNDADVDYHIRSYGYIDKNGLWECHFIYKGKEMYATHSPTEGWIVYTAREEILARLL